mgnify:CR=1 FL=1
MNNLNKKEKQHIYKSLQNYCTTLSEEFNQITPERKTTLEEIGSYIFEKIHAGKAVNITVICTHNSRRSHMGQLWLEAAAAWYGVENVHGFSGGTEATAFNPRAVAAMERAGFKISKLYNTENPNYEARLGKSFSPIIMFSKKYDDPFNPAKNFAAVMVCSEADAACPIVPGAEERFAIPYQDPKHYDDTPSEKDQYDERCRQIAREFFYLMAHAKHKLVLAREKDSTK